MFNIFTFIIDMIIEFFKEKKTRKLNAKVNNLEREIEQLKKQEKNQVVNTVSRKSFTLDDIIKMKTILGYFISEQKGYQEKIYFTSINDLNFQLNESVYGRGYKLKELLVFEYEDCKLMKIRNIIRQYGKIYIEFRKEDTDPLLLQRREMIRDKTNYYQLKRQHQRDMVKKLEDMGVVFEQGKELDDSEFIRREKERGISGTYMAVH